MCGVGRARCRNMRSDTSSVLLQSSTKLPSFTTSRWPVHFCAALVFRTVRWLANQPPKLYSQISLPAANLLYNENIKVAEGKKQTQTIQISAMAVDESFSSTGSASVTATNAVQSPAVRIDDD